MALPVLSCGVFKWELEKILPEVQKELGAEITANFLPSALDVSETKLETALREGLKSFDQQGLGKRAAFLYGSMCHGNMAGFAGESGSVYPKPSNCAEILLGPEKKKEFDATGNVYYLTAGGLRLWREIYREGHGWDDVDARMNFAGMDRIIVLDAGVIEISDEELFDFFEYIQVPVEIEKISLEHFKSVVIDLCRRLSSSGTLQNGAG
jgi:hypothetical protein